MEPKDLLEIIIIPLVWRSLEDHDWDQWAYALGELSRRYDSRLRRFKRQGKIGEALNAWECLHQLAT